MNESGQEALNTSQIHQTRCEREQQSSLRLSERTLLVGLPEWTGALDQTKSTPVEPVAQTRESGQTRTTGQPGADRGRAGPVEWRLRTKRRRRPASLDRRQSATLLFRARGGTMISASPAAPPPYAVLRALYYYYILQFYVNLQIALRNVSCACALVLVIF